MLQHFNDCIKQAKSFRQQAVQMNIFTAVLCSLKVMYELLKSSVRKDIEKLIWIYKKRSSTKRTSTSSHWKLTCSSHDRAFHSSQASEKLPVLIAFFPHLLCFQKWKCQSESKMRLCFAYWFSSITSRMDLSAWFISGTSHSLRSRSILCPCQLSVWNYHDFHLIRQMYDDTAQIL